MTQATSYLELFEVHTGASEETACTYMMGCQLGDISPIEAFELALHRGDKTLMFDRWSLMCGVLTHEGDHVIRTDQIVGVNQCQYTQFINWEIPRHEIEDAFGRIYGTVFD